LTVSEWGRRGKDATSETEDDAEEVRGEETVGHS
jgi:hypothetical protein